MAASSHRNCSQRTMRLYTMSCMRSAWGMLYPTMYFTCTARTPLRKLLLDLLNSDICCQSLDQP